MEQDGTKSAKQLRKEGKKAEKLEKFKAKQEKSKADMSKSANKKVEITKSDGVNKRSAGMEVKFDANGKKDVSSFPKSYDPEFVESGWYNWWSKQGLFAPDDKNDGDKDNFVMIMPPPNVTGTLHLGHALMCTLQDILARFHRMKGKNVLWVPGSDHAGIATQVVVEKWLYKTTGLRRQDIGREAFIDKVWSWKEEKGGRIEDQIKLMGSSCDWTRSFFTMDEQRCAAVKEAFIRLFDRGEIYRESRIVNWCVTLQSVISDTEVVKFPIKARTQIAVPGYEKKITFGLMTKFAYKFADNDNEEIVVATTRLETMLGDVAVAVHPSDERYKHLHGRFVKHPFFADRKVIVVADDNVQIEFGTGAVKISPGHDQMDFDIAKKCGLPIFGCFNDDGTIAEGFGQFAGMKRFDARRAIEAELGRLGLIRGDKIETEMVLPVCSRSSDVIEPMVKPQWFLKMTETSLAANKLIGKLKGIEILPEQYLKECIRHLNNMRDWCLSRQLWWGHRIPAYRAISQDNSEKWYCGHDEEDIRRKYGLGKDVVLKQDEDVLDTWFSSALLPFSSLGWPSQTNDLQKYFPGQLLETGHDILFFWVIRMIVMSMKLQDGKLPFERVYLHGLIRDSQGRKMSKSLGNMVDPADVIKGASLEALRDHLRTYNLDAEQLQNALIEQKVTYPKGIPQCGTDALRFTFASYSTQNKDINLDVLRVVGYRCFCNKIWNAFKYCKEHFLSYGSAEAFIAFLRMKQMHIIDNWILKCLCECVTECNEGLKNYEFNQASSALHKFFQQQFCDHYIEYSKYIFYRCYPQADEDDHKNSVRRILTMCFKTFLELIHPIMPFLSEELYQRMPQVSGSVSQRKYPEPRSFCQSLEFGDVRGVTISHELTQWLRNLRSVAEMAPKARLGPVHIEQKVPIHGFETTLAHVQILINSKHVGIIENKNEIDEDKFISMPFSWGKVYVSLEDLDTSKLAQKMKAKSQLIGKQISKLRSEIQSDESVDIMPDIVRKQSEEKLNLLTEENEHLLAALSRLNIDA